MSGWEVGQPIGRGAAEAVRNGCDALCQPVAKNACSGLAHGGSGFPESYEENPGTFRQLEVVAASAQQVALKG